MQDLFFILASILPIRISYEHKALANLFLSIDLFNIFYKYLLINSKYIRITTNFK